ncbi:DinB family protein [Kitasatospora sp. NBC_01287]|uniref:mycothiol transferase n=1 Tax=Kitasatospora sp. NBC_01287 TaxID=2903573 RepID=UPI002255E03F|nr:DinB family protein [Kitasatospora sp. NBC_01287]MCX4744518.1 DinB family protein [Kitasatospora sp. NBC_01287]
MTSADLLTDAFGRAKEAVHEAVKGLGPKQLTARLDEEANSVAWLVWHLTRVQDDHLADVMATEQLWTAAGWREKFDLPFPADETGYGHDPEQVARVQLTSRRLLTDYYDAVHRQTLEFVRTLTDADLDRVVDERWSPPVTLGVRLVSVVTECLQHAGQAAFIRGVLLRRSS